VALNTQLSFLKGTQEPVYLPISTFYLEEDKTIAQTHDNIYQIKFKETVKCTPQTYKAEKTKVKCIPSGDLMGDISFHPGYNRDIFSRLRAMTTLQ